MGFINSLTSGLASTNKYQAEQAPTINPVTGQQAQQAYDTSQDAIRQQQAFLQQLQAQNGAANQSSVFNQLQGITNGTGPNPAQAMLANATGANTANQAALMASQRGVGSNPALIARQAAMQGAANQQNAIGQGAALQANQSLNALNQQGGIANQMVGNLSGATQNYNQNAQNEQANLLNAIHGQNMAAIQNLGNQQSLNAGAAANNAANQAVLNQGALSAAGGGAQFIGKKAGVGGQSTDTTSPMGAPNAGPQLPAGAEGGQVTPSGFAHFTNNYNNPHAAPIQFAQGGTVPALVSPGERYLPPAEVKKVAEGKKAPIKAGEKIPGRPKHPGNDYRNDTVHKHLETGGIVIPNAVMQSKDPAKSAADFVRAILAKQGMKKK